MTRVSDNKREFYVIQFIELPFEGINDYVCVPYTWLNVVHPTYGDEVVVPYPKDEDLYDTRDRVERKERYNDGWRSYMAIVLYHSDSYDDAECWIAAKYDYDKQPKFPFNKKLCSGYQVYQNLSKYYDNFWKPLPISIKRTANTETRKEIDEKRLKQDKPAPSSSAIVNDAKVEARSPKIDQSVIIQDILSMEFSQAEKSSVASDADESTESRSKIPRTEQTEKAPISADHNNSKSQANSSRNTMDVSMTATKPTTSAEQSTRPNQYNHQEYIPDRCSLSNFQPQIENVRSLANVDDHKQPVTEVPSQKQPTFYGALNSLNIFAQLQRHMKEGRRLVPIQKTLEKTIRPMKMEINLAIAAQNPSNLINQTRHLSTRSVQQH